MSSILSLLSLLPLLFYVVDGYYEKNIQKGLSTIGLFVVLTTAALLLTKWFGIYFALSTPILMLVYLIISETLRKKE